MPLGQVCGVTGAGEGLERCRDREFVQWRHRIITENQELQQRELMKLSSISAALAETLRYAVCSARPGPSGARLGQRERESERDDREHRQDHQGRVDADGVCEHAQRRGHQCANPDCEPEGDPGREPAASG